MRRDSSRLQPPFPSPFLPRNPSGAGGGHATAALCALRAREAEPKIPGPCGRGARAAVLRRSSARPRAGGLRPYIASYAAWAAASGVSGAWDETDALGIHNVFRYAFDKPFGAFTNPPLLSITFDASGNPVVLTPPLVNGEGFDLSILATDTLAGDNPATYPLDPSGTNAIPASAAPSRFFRLRAEGQ